MPNLFIKKLKKPKQFTLQTAGHLLEQNTIVNAVNVLNWEKEFPYKPLVKFRMGHATNEIWLKYYVEEKNILARETRTNGDVYKDSTVEFFISLDEQNYYNFEFSCIGTRHVAFGPGRNNRKFVAPEIVEKINIESTLGSIPFEEQKGNFEWEMMIRIPVECFAFDQLKSFDGIKATGNFMKCGDETSDPHFVSWNPIQTKTPDYHCPQFFGKIKFE